MMMTMSKRCEHLDGFGLSQVESVRAGGRVGWYCKICQEVLTDFVEQYLYVCDNVDSYIDEQIEALEAQRERLKIRQWVGAFEHGVGTWRKENIAEAIQEEYDDVVNYKVFERMLKKEQAENEKD
jgi:hypothetical protein